MGAKIHFIKDKCEILNSNDELIGIAHYSKGLFRLPCTIVEMEHAYISKSVDVAHVACTTTASASIDVWHAHLGHISMDSIYKMACTGMVKGMDIIVTTKDAPAYCEECEMSAHAVDVKKTRSGNNQATTHKPHPM